MKKPASGAGSSNAQVRSSTASFLTQLADPLAVALEVQPPGVIGRLAALVVRGLPGHAVVAEDHVVGGEDRAVVERRRDNRRPDRHAVDPLRRGERRDRIGIARIHLHGCVEHGGVRVIVREAAVPLLIQAPAVVGAGGDDRGVQIDLVERPGHGTFGLLGQRVGHGGLFLLFNGLGLLFGLLLGLLLLWLLLGLLLHDLLLLLLRLSDSLLTVVVVAAADQRQPGRTDAGPRRGPQQRPPRHLVAP